MQRPCLLVLRLASRCCTATCRCPPEHTRIPLDFFFHTVARFNTLRPRAARSAWEGGPPQAPRRRLAAEAAQAAEPVEVLLWLALVPWPVWWLVLWRVLRSGLWRVLLRVLLWLALLRLVLRLVLWLVLRLLQADTRRPKADCAYAS